MKKIIIIGLVLVLSLSFLGQTIGGRTDKKNNLNGISNSKQLMVEVLPNNIIDEGKAFSIRVTANGRGIQSGVDLFIPKTGWGVCMITDENGNLDLTAEQVDEDTYYIVRAYKPKHEDGSGDFVIKDVLHGVSMSE